MNASIACPGSLTSTTAESIVCAPIVEAFFTQIFSILSWRLHSLEVPTQIAKNLGMISQHDHARSYGPLDRSYNVRRKMRAESHTWCAIRTAAVGLFREVPPALACIPWAECWIEIGLLAGTSKTGQLALELQTTATAMRNRQWVLVAKALESPKAAFELPRVCGRAEYLMLSRAK